MTFFLHFFRSSCSIIKKKKVAQGAFDYLFQISILASAYIDGLVSVTCGSQGC